MKILVTGGAGFIGSHIVDELIREGHYVRIFDNLEPQVHTQVPSYLNKDAEFIKGDVRDIPAMEAAIEDMDVIFHEAAMVGVGQSMYQVKRYVDVNTAGTANLLDLLVNKNHDVKKLIVASSMSIYGEGTYACEDCGIVYPALRSDEQLKSHDWEMKCPNCNKYVKPVPTKESKPLLPTSIYAVTKKDQEEMSLAIGRSYGLPTVALRYFNVFGPRQALSNPYTGVCAIFSSRIKNNNPPIVFEDGLQSRDFVSVHDIVQANMLALNKSRANYNVFNVGTGKQASISGVAAILAGLYGKKLVPDVVNKYRSGDIRHCFADISKIKKLGFEPSVSIDAGMKALVDWGKTQEAEDRGEKAYRELKERGLVER
jgi:dTDP-L-rhamnose 4-epimerase